MASASSQVCLLMMMVSILQSSESKTVVIIPFPFTSHTKYHAGVARHLAKHGHQVWLTMPTYLSEKGYLDTSGFHTIPYETMPELEKTTMTLLSETYFQDKDENFFAFLRLSEDIADRLLRNQTFISTIQQLKPDLIVIDNLPLYYTMCVLPYKLGIPFAFLGTIYYPPLLRVPFSPAEVPMNVFPYSNKMTFTQRLKNTLFILLIAIYNPSLPTNAVATYAPEKEYVPLDVLVARAEIWLVETDHVLDYPKPTIPNVKFIGGTVAGSAKPLPPEIQSFMDSATEGVVIVSFGSYVLDLPKNVSDKILQVLLQLPMKAVLRSNLASPDPNKIWTSAWIPQNDLLGHVNTKVFVSHCGKNGQYEALYHAVPIVATPLFSDQPFNAERARVKGFAEIVDLRKCSVEEMKSVILQVANDPRYKQSVIKYSRLFRQLYGTPMETAAFWLDHVMEYGGDYMRSAGQIMPLYQFLLLDVMLVIVLALSLIVGLVFGCVCAVYRCVCRRTKAKLE